MTSIGVPARDRGSCVNTSTVIIAVQSLSTLTTTGFRDIYSIAAIVPSNSFIIQATLKNIDDDDDLCLVIPSGAQVTVRLSSSSFVFLWPYLKSTVYTVNHKKGGSTFVIITLEYLHRFL